MNSEIWKPIVGYEGLYEVSNKGRVRSLPRMTHYDAGFEKRNDGKILTPSKASKYKSAPILTPEQIKRLEEMG